MVQRQKLKINSTLRDGEINPAFIQLGKDKIRLNGFLAEFGIIERNPGNLIKGSEYLSSRSGCWSR